MALTEKQKMLAGELYLASDPALVLERRRARRLTRLFNQTGEEDTKQRKALLGELFGRPGQGLFVEPPFYCDYGSNIFFGDNVFLNFNCVILDCNMVQIGHNVQIAPGVQIYAADHPLDAAQRSAGPELARPIAIGNNVWIGGTTIICPGVTIGDNTTVGAGSVVTRDIPSGVFAAGNPCRVIRKLA